MYFCTAKFGLTDGVTGNTSDFDSEKSRFEPWSVNHNKEESRKLDSSFYFMSNRARWLMGTQMTLIELIRRTADRGLSRRFIMLVMIN